MTSFDLDDFTSEERNKVENLIKSIREEKEKAKDKKWWIMPRYPLFSKEEEHFGQSYYVEEQREDYSRSRPPLKTDFSSKEEAEQWLENYRAEEKLFKSAQEQLDNLVCNLGLIRNKLQQHKMIPEDDWTDCFRMFNESRVNGELAEVTK